MLFFNHLLELSLDAAPYLLLGLILAGLIKAWLPEAWVRRQLSGQGKLPIIKAALLGAPMPLCSCSVIPVALGIRRSGASKGATTSFLISTPETGVDSISLTYAMMGPVMAIVRPVAAILTALAAGFWVENSNHKSCCGSEQSQTAHTEPNSKPSCCASKSPEPANAVSHSQASCCASKSPEPANAVPHGQASCCASKSPEPANAVSHGQASCCASKSPEPANTVSHSQTSCCASKSPEPANAVSHGHSHPQQSPLAGIHYAFGRLYDDILVWLAIGLVIAAAVQTFIPPDWLAQWGSGWLAKFMMLMIGIPMYICASASTPMAAGLMLAGVSPGTVLVFLLAGPATNIATIAVLKNELGQSVMVKYIITVMLGSLIAGVVLDAALMNSSLDLLAQHHHHAQMLPLWLSGSCLAILLLATIKPLRQIVFSRLGVS